MKILFFNYLIHLLDKNREIYHDLQEITWYKLDIEENWNKYSDLEISNVSTINIQIHY